MFKATKDMILPTTVTGSLPRPVWYTQNLDGRALSHAMTDVVFREQYADAVAVMISDQQRAGLDILVDGDARFDLDVAGRSWFAYLGERLKGLAPANITRQPFAMTSNRQPGDILWEVTETRMTPTVVGKVERGPLEYARLWKIAQRCTCHPVKLGGISAQEYARVLIDDHYKDRRRLIMDLSEELNKEYHELADAGCPIIQVEEPAIHELLGIVDMRELSAEFLLDAFNREVKGLREKTEVWVHTCWGSPAAQRVDFARHSYMRALPYIDKFDADVITFETADNDGADIELICKGISKDKKICIGVVSHRQLNVERPEEVAALIRKALQFVPPERLIVSTDCGFGRQGMSRMHAFYKMVAIVRGTNIVRKEIGLPERQVLASDPAYSLMG